MTMGMMHKRIDNKHSMVREDGKGSDKLLYVAKRLADGTLQPIPEEEPVILFRGRDKLALPMLEHYRALCAADGATDYQLEFVDDMIRRFREFATASPTMKQPGSTRGM